MKITINFSYHTENVVPPRCRKPRTVFDNATTTVEIPEVTSADAPVAFRVPARTWRSDEYVPTVTEWRWWDQRLFLPYLPWSRQEEPSLAGSKYFPAEVEERYTYGNGLDEVSAGLRKHYAGFLIIDGVVWQEQSGEPVYEACTFGLGHNHGGSALLIGSYHGDDGGRFGNYFRADQFELARDRALEIARNRGDDESFDSIRNARRIEVLIPEAIRSDPQQDAAIADGNEELAIKLPRREWAALTEHLTAVYARPVPAHEGVLTQLLDKIKEVL